MKVLWFTNTKVNLDRNGVHGGWMQILETHLIKNENIELFIATKGKGTKQETINKGSTTYIMIPDRRNIFQKRLDLILNREPTVYNINQYINILNRVKPDIIHIFGTEMDFGLINKYTEIPVIIHIQGILNPIYYHLQKILPSFWKSFIISTPLEHLEGSTILNGLRIWKRRSKVEIDIFKSCKYFMGRTDWDKQITNLLSDNAKYFHCDEMIKSVFFQNKWEWINSKHLNLVSNIGDPSYKGHETIINTAIHLKNKGIPFNWHIIGIDKHGSAYRLFYRKFKNELSENLVFHGELRPEVFINIIKGSNLYIHPSHIENSSNSICEAMATGIPVISVYTGGSVSIIDNGIDGILVPDNDPCFFAAKIIEIWQNRKLCLELSEKARSRAQTRHNPVKIAADLFSIYKTLVNERNYATSGFINHFKSN